MKKLSTAAEEISSLNTTINSFIVDVDKVAYLASSMFRKDQAFYDRTTYESLFKLKIADAEKLMPCLRNRSDGFTRCFKHFCQ